MSSTQDSSPTSPTKPPRELAAPADQPFSLKGVTDRVLVFLSNATNETIGACLVGLGATTYFVFGRVGLVLIGVVGGVVLHAHWEAGGGGQDDAARLVEHNKRREAGVYVVQRVLDWQSRKKALEPASPEEELALRASDFSDFRPQTAAALTVLTETIIGDYVKWWYSPILPSEIAFPSACRQTLNSFVLAVANNVSRKRPADTFLEFTTNSSSIIIVFFSELSSALSASPSSKPQDALKTYLRLKPESSLANLMDHKHQLRKLRMIADDVLEKYLDSNVYRCGPARIFLREMFANVILDMTIQRCSKPEWINDWIVYLLEEGEPEIMNAIDAGVEEAGGPQEVKRQAQAVEDTPLSPTSPVNIRANHKRTVSRAEEAMDEAMKEAQRLTQLIIEEDERRQRELQSSSQQLPDGASKATTDGSDGSDTTGTGIYTPESSQAAENDDGKPQPRTSDDSPLEKASLGSISASPPSQHDASFEQIAAQSNVLIPTESAEAAKQRQSEPFTLHKANTQIFDDGLSGEKRPAKSKPTAEYMIQIEPASSAFPGWMIPRTYTDFETLHEILRRIANVSGVPFSKLHPELPSWRTLNKLRLRDELDRYLSDAMQFEQLAESEGMKRFLEKERGFGNGSHARGFWPNPAQMGKGMFEALTKAPTQVAGGGKALLGGVANAFGHNAQKNNSAAVNAKRMSMSQTQDGRPALASNNSSSRMSFDALRKPMAGPMTPPLPRLSADTRRSSSSTLNSLANIPNGNTLPSAIHDRLEELAAADQPRRRSETPEMQLPPPPDVIPDDYTSPGRVKPRIHVPEHTSQMSVDGTSFFDVPTPSSRDLSPQPPFPRTESPRGRHGPSQSTSISTNLRIPKQRDPAPAKSKQQPLSEQEAQVTVELLFAVINELYTLSSAWNIRRTLLTAAKSFLLRPGNPQLESIRALLQESVLDANTSDSGVAAHLLKLRENSMPTEEELKKWPPEPSIEEKEALRLKARRLLVERGMPQALTSVMGTAASGEALGKVFDCLQVQEVARGLMFGLLLQGVRAATQ